MHFVNVHRMTVKGMDILRHMLPSSNNAGYNCLLLAAALLIFSSDSMPRNGVSAVNIDASLPVNERLKGKLLRYAVPMQQKQWLVSNDVKEDGLPSGAMGALFRRMTTDAGLSTEWRNISAESLAKSPLSSYTACAVDISEGSAGHVHWRLLRYSRAQNSMLFFSQLVQ